METRGQTKSQVKTCFPWSNLPQQLKLMVYEYAFLGAVSIYLFAPGNSTHPDVESQNKETQDGKRCDEEKDSHARARTRAHGSIFVVTNTEHVNLLRASKDTWRVGRGVYFRVATVVFRGYERLMNDAISKLPSMVRYVVQLNVPLHFVRWMIARGNIARFGSLRKLMMEDMSFRGFDIEGDAPSHEDILTTLYKKDTEISRIHELLVEEMPIASSGCDVGNGVIVKDVCDGGAAIEVLFQFEIFDTYRPTKVQSDHHLSIPIGMPESSKQQQQQQQQHRHHQSLKTGGFDDSADDNCDDKKPQLRIREFVLDVRHKSLRQIGARLRIKDA